MFGKRIEVGPACSKDEKAICPLIHQTCVRGACRAWVQMRGTHPQTGAEIDEWGCGLFDWLPILLVENAKETRGCSAATESFRNEMVRVAMSRAPARRAIPLTHGYDPDDR